MSLHREEWMIREPLPNRQVQAESVFRTTAVIRVVRVPVHVSDVAAENKDADFARGLDRSNRVQCRVDRCCRHLCNPLQKGPAVTICPASPPGSRQYRTRIRMAGIEILIVEV